jgi:hypothetical protein
MTLGVASCVDPVVEHVKDNLGAAFVMVILWLNDDAISKYIIKRKK